MHYLLYLHSSGSNEAYTLVYYGLLDRKQVPGNAANK